MKRVHFLAASAVLILWSVGPVSGAPKPRGASSAGAKMIFEQIDAWSGTIADEAFQLGAMARSERSPESHLEGLATLRADVNSIGAEIQSLEAERDSLSGWEAKALDQITPLMQDVADKAEKAIQTFNTDRQRLWATSYAADTETISKDAGEVATLLRDYLKLAKAQQQESQLEHRLGEPAGN
jgi:hypothetical protein